MIALLSMIIPVAAGWLLTYVFWRSPANVFSTLLRLSVGIGIGIGLSSCVFFLMMVAWGPGRLTALGADLALLLLSVVAAWVARSKATVSSAESTSGFAPEESEAPLAGKLFLGALILSLIGLAVLCYRMPHGAWDGWAIWNMRARFLFRGAAHWRDAFSPLLSWSHPDYPLLVPATITRSWFHSGAETVAAPILLAVLFFAALQGTMVGALSLTRGEGDGYLAGLALLGTPLLVLSAASQYADVPLALYLLLTAVALLLYEQSDGAQPGLLILAGLTAGLSAWTKNEGILFSACVVVSWVGMRMKGARTNAVELAWFVGGCIPVAAVVALFKLTLAPPNDLLAGLHWQTLADRLFDISRYGAIAVWLFRAVLFYAGIAALLWLVSARGLQENVFRRTAVVVPAGALVLLACGYIAAYLVSPHEVSWHVRTSAPRLLLQLWPAVVLTVFAATRSWDHIDETTPVGKRAVHYRARQRRSV